MKVLIAEDDQSTRNTLKAMALRWELDPIMAEDSEEAWEIMQQPDAPQLLILDWIMPGLTGLELCQRIREHEPKDNPSYIVILTARNKIDDLVEALGSGANDYISKPFNVAELKARIMVGQRMLALQGELLSAKTELLYQASHDYLTGILNRQGILERLEQELQRAKREQCTVAVAICDIDHFKRVNDNYGHHVGDHVLKQFAQTIKQKLRPYDHVGRYGGEEFLLVLSGKTTDFVDVVERVQKQIAASPVELDGDSITITISVGLSNLLHDDNYDRERLLLTADAALYQAKESGRNRVVKAP